MRWAADVSDGQFRTIGLLEVLGALGETDRLVMPIIVRLLALFVAIASLASFPA